MRGILQRPGEFHREHYAGIQPASQDIPFCGGLLGYLGYDTGNALHGISKLPPTDLPPARLHAYDWCLVQDHLLRRSVLVTQPRVSARLRQDLLARVRQPLLKRTAEFGLHGSFVSNFDQPSTSQPLIGSRPTSRREIVTR